MVLYGQMGTGISQKTKKGVQGSSPDIGQPTGTKKGFESGGAGCLCPVTGEWQGTKHNLLHSVHNLHRSDFEGQS